MKIKLPPELLWLCPVQVPDLIRLGAKMDGGYLVTKTVVEHSQGLLSFGICDDWTFDQDWRNLKPTDPIDMYDASITRDTMRVHANHDFRCGIEELRIKYDQFFQGNIRHVPEFIGPENFDLALERLGVDQVFIKMDIEGSEYGLIDKILEHSDRITGIAMEWHGCGTRSGGWYQSVARLKQKYSIVHMHGNNSVDYDENGVLTCMELTHIRNDLISSQELRKQVHVPRLDYSNLVGRPDYEYFFE